MAREYGGMYPEQGAMGGEPREEESGGMKEKVQHKAREIGENVKERTSEMAEHRKSQVAGKFERIGERVSERARSLEEAGGFKARAGHVLERVGHAADRSASYLRTHHMDEMRSDFEAQVREHPLRSVAMALGAGYVLGRILS